MKWLTNTYDPKRPGARNYLRTLADEDRNEAWERWQRYLSDKVIGEPMPTAARSVEEMKRENLVGVYKPE